MVLRVFIYPVEINLTCWPYSTQNTPIYKLCHQTLLISSFLYSAYKYTKFPITKSNQAHTIWYCHGLIPISCSSHFQSFKTNDSCISLAPIFLKIFQKIFQVYFSMWWVYLPQYILWFAMHTLKMRVSRLFLQVAHELHYMSVWSKKWVDRNPDTRSMTYPRNHLQNLCNNVRSLNN